MRIRITAGKIRTTVIILNIFAALLLMCACEQEKVPKTSFGKVDPLQEGVIINNTVQTREKSTDDVSAAAVNEDDDSSSDKTNGKELDVDDLPSDVARMIPICDAINLACIELNEAYSASNRNLVWASVHAYVCNSDDMSLGIKPVGDALDVDSSVVNDIIYAMFGKIREIPPIPRNTESGNESENISINTDLQYRFLTGDRGMSKPEVIGARQYPDGALEMEVALVDSETDEEIVSFIYTMRANTRDTTSDAMFLFEITGSRPGDRITEDKMNGIPFLTAVMQTYGYDSYDSDDIRYKEVTEVLTFLSFKKHVPGLDELNGEISHEILECANEPSEEGTWREICSYPLTTDKYVQVATTVATYPNDGSDPVLHSYNYDKSKRRAMDKNDALGLCDIIDPDLENAVITLTQSKFPDASVSDAGYNGFIVRKEGSVDVFYSVRVDDGAKEAVRLVAYNSGTKDIRIVFEEGDVVPAEECDDLKPILTHGRKE
mgnify:CR=1 FL=1